jgi:hypothetical protein
MQWEHVSSWGAAWFHAGHHYLGSVKWQPTACLSAALVNFLVAMQMYASQHTLHDYKCHNMTLYAAGV